MATADDRQVLPDTLQRGDRLTFAGGPVCTVVSIRRGRADRDDYNRPKYVLHVPRWTDPQGWGRPPQNSDPKSRDTLQGLGYVLQGGQG